MTARKRRPRPSSRIGVPAPRPRVGGEKAPLGYAEVQARGALVEDTRCAAHPVVTKENWRLVGIEKLRRHRRIGQVGLAALHPKRGRAERGRGGVPPAEARLMARMSILVQEGAAIREQCFRTLQHTSAPLEAALPRSWVSGTPCVSRECSSRQPARACRGPGASTRGLRGGRRDRATGAAS